METHGALSTCGVIQAGVCENCWKFQESDVLEFLVWTLKLKRNARHFIYWHPHPCT